MSQKPSYILGINAYDHDTSACLLRDGEIAYAINKERITRRKHDTGFFQDVVDYCLKAEGISLDDVDLVVRNCYVLSVTDLEKRLVSEDVPKSSTTTSAGSPTTIRSIFEIRQGRHRFASSRACLQRVCRLAVQGGRHHGGGRRRQLLRGREGAGSARSTGSIRSHVNWRVTTNSTAPRSKR